MLAEKNKQSLNTNHISNSWINNWTFIGFTSVTPQLMASYLVTSVYILMSSDGSPIESGQ